MAYDLNDRYKDVQQQIAQACARVGRSYEEVRLITVTKTQPAEVLQSVIDTGYSDIGENRVQEIVQKVPLLCGEKTMHMIGHLQSNKVSKVMPFVDWIQSIDSEKLLFKVEKQCEDINKKMNILIQVNTSGEVSKSGCNPEEALTLCETAAKCSYINFRGLMTIGPLGGDDMEIRKSFIQLRTLCEKCRDLSDDPIELSMGMSGDFQIAIEEGSTMVRIGSLILGSRAY